MAEPLAASPPVRPALAAANAAVVPAILAGGLLVGQQVAAKATRDALFLSSFPVTMLPAISALAACLSLVGVLMFSRAMTRASPPMVMRLALATSATVLLAQWRLAFAAPRLAALAVYLHVALFGATLLSGFWSVINETFDPHTARRVVGRIGAGATLGGVAGGLLTWRAADAIGVPAMLLVMAGLTAATLVALEAVHRSHPGRLEPAMGTAPPGAASALGLIAQHPYLRNMALLVTLCALTDAVLDYVLSAVVVRQISGGPALMSFFALFHTVVGVVALAVQSAAAGPALQKLGLGGTLAIPPALVAAGAVVTAWLPGVAASVGLRGLQAVLRNSLFRSAYELLYTPLPPDRKRSTKALLDVGADRVGTMAGGALVMAVLLVPVVSKVRALLLLAAGLAAASVLLARHLQKGYVAALADSLRAGTIRLDREPIVDQGTRATLMSWDAGDALGVRDPQPEAAAPRSLPDPAPLLERAAALRSPDLARVRAALIHDGPLAPELVPFVVPLLARDELFTAAVAALRTVADRCTGQLLDVLLDPSRDPALRRRVPRVLKAVPTQRAFDGLFLALRDDRFDVRYRVAQALIRLHRQDPSLSVPEGASFAAARRELKAGRPSPRAVEHVIGLLSLGLPGEPLPVALRAWRSGESALRGTALEYLENVLPADVWASLWPWLGSRPSPTGRPLDDVRDDLLRSTASWTAVRRSAATGGSAGMRGREREG
jgi:AAA family ATP:ADP antiporter